MELKGTKQVVIRVDYNDVEKLINKYYFNGTNEFSIVASQEMSNDSQFEVDVDGVLTEYDLDCLSNKDQDYGATYNYLNDLANKGIIEMGTYIINICW